MLIRFSNNVLLYGKNNFKNPQPLKEFLGMRNQSMREIAPGTLSTSLGMEILKELEQKLKYLPFICHTNVPFMYFKGVISLIYCFKENVL